MTVYQQTALAKVVIVFSANSFKKWFIRWTGTLQPNHLTRPKKLVSPAGSCIYSKERSVWKEY